jgi:hypothetical protein
MGLAFEGKFTRYSGVQDIRHNLGFGNTLRYGGKWYMPGMALQKFGFKERAASVGRWEAKFMWLPKNALKHIKV